MIIIKIFLLTLFLSMNITAQSVNNIHLHHMRKPRVRKEIKIPNILGLKTLKGDFHIHTVFSDGIAWPTYRVDEAWEEGLDIIAITDHIEGYPNKPFLNGDHNSSYNVALPNAIEKGIILIHAAEITRGMPPGHMNALFIKDANKLDVETVDDAVKAAVDQGAFILWNHPGWEKHQPDTTLWMPLHEKYFTNGWINGIEVFNEYEWYPISIDWCIDKNLAVFANSDIHDISGHFYDIERCHRPMTLVFSKEKDEASIKQALEEGRTVAWFDDKLVGKEEYLKALFEESVDIKFSGRYDAKDRPIIEIKNNSNLKFVITDEKGKEIVIYADKAVQFPYSLGETVFSFNNLYIGTEKNLKVNIEIK